MSCYLCLLQPATYSTCDCLFQALEQLIREAPAGKVVAVGECGLDYKRQQFCAPATQRKYFEMQVSLRRASPTQPCSFCLPILSYPQSTLQLNLSQRTKLPLFLHLRDAEEDFLKIVEENKDKIHGGVVHSFDCSLDVAKRLVRLDYGRNLAAFTIEFCFFPHFSKRLTTASILASTAALCASRTAPRSCASFPLTASCWR